MAARGRGLVLTESEAARFLGGSRPLSVSTLRKWRAAGRGPKWVRMGAAVRYVEGDLIEFMTNSTTAATGGRRGTWPPPITPQRTATDAPVAGDWPAVFPCDTIVDTGDLAPPKQSRSSGKTGVTAKDTLANL